MNRNVDHSAANLALKSIMHGVSHYLEEVNDLVLRTHQQGMNNKILVLQIA